MLNGYRYATYKLVFSPLSQRINLFSSDRNFYIQLKCGLSTWGYYLNTIKQYGFKLGYWFDQSGLDLCSNSGKILEYVSKFLICDNHFLKSYLSYFSFDNNNNLSKAYNDDNYKQPM